MKKLLLFIFMVITGHVIAQNWLWAKSAPGTTINGDEGLNVATDASGNVFIVGVFSSPFIFFGTDTLFNSGYQSGYQNICLAKFSPSGAILWAQNAGAGYAMGIATDASGNVYITGLNSGSIIFGTDTINSSFFIAKYNAGGNVLWARGTTSSGPYDYANSIATDASGNVYVTGVYKSPFFIFGSDTLHNTVGSSFVFIAKYDNGGNILWAKNAVGNVVGTSGEGDAALSISTDLNGNAYITGHYISSKIIFGTDTLFNFGWQNIFLVKYNTNGTMIWAKGSNGNSASDSYGVSTDLSGNIYITGYFSSPFISFGTDTLFNTELSSQEFFLAKYNALGNILWTKSSAGGNYNNTAGYSVSNDPSGNVYVSGGCDTLIVFGADTLHAPSGSPDPMFIVKYNSSGSVLCTSILTSGGDDNNGVSADAFGNAYITGDFISNPFVVGNTTLINKGLENIFVAKFTCNEVSIKEYTDNQEINIYPNPANRQLIIETYSTDMQTVDLFDLNGRLILSEIIRGKIIIDVSNLNEGIYLLTIKTIDRVSNKKIVIMR